MIAPLTITAHPPPAHALPAGSIIPDNTLRRIRRAKEAAPHGMKGVAIGNWAARLECSKDKIYRALRRKDGPSDKRAGSGRKRSIPEYVIDMAEDIIQRGRDIDPEGRTLPADIVIDKLRRRGVPPQQLPSEASLNRRKRERGFDANPRYRRLEADFALQQLQADASQSELFQITDHDDERGYVLTVTSNYRKYKADNKSLRPWILAIKDSFSRLVFGRMYATTGESGALMLQFLGDFWQPPEDAERIFRHVPPPGGVLQFDRGSPGRSDLVAHGLRMIGVSCEIAQSKEGQGKIERNFEVLWPRFELDMAEEMGEGETILMSEYNDELERFFIREGRARKHPMLRALSREDAYRASIRQTEPRTVEADILKLAFTVEERTVNRNGHVQFYNDLFEVPEEAHRPNGRPVLLDPGTRIRVCKNGRGQLVGQCLDEYAEPFTLAPYEQPALRDFSGPSATENDKVAGRIDAARSGADDVKPPEVDDDVPTDPPEAPRRSLTDAPDDGGSVRTLPPRTTEITPDGPFAAGGAQLLPEREARRYVARRLKARGLSYAGAQGAFEDVLGDATREELDALVSAYTHRTQTG